ncbi:hypothetical protein [Sulfobacillus thermosulfidooxidans]|uniref:hypothetical protein n=1 Tax=Sulfobacillus thermosulfidooxidans TaxID=28034 RepID=UPI0006B64BAB|nr:hypothetical protein [Sulfobacillus thermosulfidooxidans]
MIVRWTHTMPIIGAASLVLGSVILTSPSRAASPRHQPSAHGQPVPAPSSSQPFWIMSTQSLYSLEQHPAALRGLAHHVVYVFAPPRSHTPLVPPPPSAGIIVKRTAYFRSLTSLQTAMAHHQLRVDQAVLLDLEHWIFTPSVEQAHIPATYAQAARLLAHTGLILIGSPSTREIVASAPYLAIADLQIQQTEFHPDTYRAKALQLVRQIHAVAPHTLITAGLSTNPRTGTATPAILARAYQAVRPFVSGFWMNEPSPGPGCPQCQLHHPQAAWGFFAWLGQSVKP